LRVYGPPGARRKIDGWLDAMSGNPALYRNALDLVEYRPGEEIKLGAMRALPVQVEHSVPAFGFRIEVGGLRRKALAYSGDTRQCNGLIELAREANLFLCEATLQDGVGDAEFNRRQLEAHMTARQAGEAASKAGARNLALTHLMYYLDPAQSQAQAQSTCLCPVSVAREHQPYDVN
jgi:ribonuclease BN (tRNA processing enzyme)